MSESRKRKQSGRDSQGDRSFKRSKGGTGGKWQTPKRMANHAKQVEMGHAIAVGDEGIWVTYARGMKSRAVTEFTEVCNEYGSILYGIKPPSDDDQVAKDDDGKELDIEASIQQELDGMKTRKKKEVNQHFQPISTHIECVFFMKTSKPVEPRQLTRRICEDAKSCPNPTERKCKYVNRLTPVSDTDKATENGIERVARAVLGRHFALKPRADQTDAEAEAEGDKIDIPAEASTYAIRPTVRNHSGFKSGDVIKKVADLIDARHKVNLGEPDKVICIEIYQLFCGISVVDGKDWEAFKKFNVNELYKLQKDTKDGEAADSETPAVEAKEETNKADS